MDSTFEGKFFKTNDRKINSLIKATKKDFKRGETAMLRQADDQYRKIIFNAQMYAASGAGTYEKAVDMATKDFLTRGITSIEYKNGSRHTMEDYSRMCLRTACKRAYFTGEGEMRNSRGQHLVIMIKRGNPCPKCAPWVGKVLIDDVWSGGSREDGDYPLMSEAIAAGLYHPNCLDSHTTYFDDGFDEEYDREHDSDTNVGNMKEEYTKYTKEERQQLADEYNIEQKAGYAKRQQERFERLEEFSLDPENKRMYGARAQEWERLKKERFKHVNMKTGGEETNIYAENIRFSSNVQKRLDKEFGYENSEEKIKRLYEEADTWKDKLKRDERRYITKYAFNPGGKGEENSAGSERMYAGSKRNWLFSGCSHCSGSKASPRADPCQTGRMECSRRICDPNGRNKKCPAKPANPSGVCRGDDSCQTGRGGDPGIPVQDPAGRSENHRTDSFIITKKREALRPPVWFLYRNY